MTKNNVFNGRSGIADFFNSYGFIWIVALITLVFWIIKQDFAGIAVLFVLMTAVLVFCEDATPALTLFVFMFFIFSNTSISFEGRELWCLLLLLPFAGFAYNIAKFKVKNFRMRGFSFAVLVALVPWLLQGIGVKNREVLRALLTIAIAIAFAAVYFLIYLTSRRNKRNLVDYVAQVFLAVSVLIVTQILIYHFRIGDYTFEDFYTRLGWGTRNPVAAILALTMPVTFYYSTKKYRFSFLFIILGYAEYIMILLLQSRGVTLFATVAMPVLVVYSMLCSERKLSNVVANGIFIIVLIVVAIFQKDVIVNLLGRLLTSKLDENGRKPLWAEGIDMFVKHPIFGVGFDYRSELYYKTVGDGEGPTYYHSTFIQIYGAMGIIGGLAYAYLYYWRYRIAFTDLSNAKFALLVGLVIFECYCFIDTVIFQPVGYFLPLMVSMCMEKDLNEEQTTPLLFYKLGRRKKEIVA
ncbi:MAG: O-antigen ligase family protein [Christensenellales bacterium]